MPFNIDPVFYEELKELNLKVKIMGDHDSIKMMNDFIEICQEIFIWEYRCVIIGCSKKYAFFDDVGGRSFNFFYWILEKIQF